MDDILLETVLSLALGDTEQQDGADHTAARVHPSSSSSTVALEGFYRVHTDTGEL